MTTRADSDFGAPDPHWGPHAQAPASQPAVAHGEEETQPGTEVQWVNTELHTIASTIQELQDRLEQANSRLSTVENVESTEVEIGRLFVEAQRFSESSLANLELRVHEVLDAAEAKALQILTEATEEAQAIRREAQQAAFTSTRTVQELQSAIAGFTVVNTELLKELGTLNDMLSPGGTQETVETVEIDPPPSAELHSTEQS